MALLNRLRDYPHILEVAYQLTERIIQGLHPFFKWIGYERADKLLRMPEKIGKGWRSTVRCAVNVHALHRHDLSNGMPEEFTQRSLRRGEIERLL